VGDGGEGRAGGDDGAGALDVGRRVDLSTGIFIAISSTLILDRSLALMVVLLS
jgi:hypothetical protein